MAVLAAVLLAAGVLRHYWDVYTHRTVRGISFLFVGIDALGDLFSLISICKQPPRIFLLVSFLKSLTLSQVFEPDLNILGMAIYGTELALWIGIFICGGYFNLVPWIKTRISRRRRQVEEEEERERRLSQDHGGVIALHQMPSSTSVFRTPSSVLVERSGTGTR